MSPSAARIHRRVEDELLKRGILLESDPELPSVVSLVAGEPVRGSWFGHPKGHDIFAACQFLIDHPDNVTTKLVSGKVTFVHRELWGALRAVVTCGEPWQLDGLGDGARDLLEHVREVGPLPVEELLASGSGDAAVNKRDVRELERRLLLHATFLPAGSGKHRKVVQTWDLWVADVKSSGGIGGNFKIKTAKGMFEVLLDTQNKLFGGNGLLPWKP